MSAAPAVAPPHLALVLRAARERAGLTQRELARRMETSWVTVREVERGRDPRRSTLQAWLRALPELSPRDLIAPAGSDSPGDRHAAWRHYTDLHGMVADEVRKTLHVLPNGDSENAQEFRGLRDLRSRRPSVRMLLGLHRAVYQGTAATLESLETDLAEADDALRSRVIERRDNRLVHQLVVPREISKEGLTVRRTIVTPDIFSFDIESYERKHDRRVPSDRLMHGSTIRLPIPARRLRFEVRFPSGFWPVETAASAWPSCFVPGLANPDVLGRQHWGGFTLRRRRTEGHLVLTVEEPLMEVGYSVSWQVGRRQAGSASRPAPRPGSA